MASTLGPSEFLLSEYRQVFARLQAPRLIARGTLPAHQSLLVYDLLLLIAHEQSHGRKTMMKNVFVSLPHSATGIRRHLRGLLRDKWLSLSLDPQDRRIRHLVLTDKGARSLLNCAEHSSLVIQPER
jgi:DNA-binding MarR family transcriptional regulator